ncbi:MAG: hypothetical protein JWQ36_3101 [Enterovirga sp.]|jgi:hypothetical protein|nr:hypothetical protein [Enterovirga sp.]
MTHKFQLNQLVRLAHTRFGDRQGGTSGLFQVTRLMPADETGEFSYRIKTAGPASSAERAVRESEITFGRSDR